MTDDWTKMGPGDRVESWDYEKEKEIVGTLVEKRENVGPNMAKMYILRLADGTKKGVWGSANIDMNMVNVPVGNDVKLIYVGVVQNPKTKRNFKKFEFFTRKHKEEQPAQNNTTEEVNVDDIPF